MRMRSGFAHPSYCLHGQSELYVMPIMVAPRSVVVIEPKTMEITR